MNSNQPNIKPQEAVSFDDLQPVAPEPETIEKGIPGLEPDDVAELPASEGGSLKDRIIAQAKKEETEAEAVEAVKEQVTVEETKEGTAKEVVPATPIETPPVPEITPETVPAETEQPKPSKPQTPTDQPTAVPSPAVAPAQVQPEKTETRKQIEAILQEGLAPMFLQMDQKERVAFTQAANETASKLEVLVTQFKASAKEVLRLIKAWLAKIPKVNKYFLEQSSKIKTDEILQVQAQKKKESRLLH